jgi:hypothetical protein
VFAYIFNLLRKKAPKAAARPQSFNYAAPQVVEQRKAAPQYYDYEEEVPTTQRPRPQYTAPQFAPQQQQQRPQQFGAGVVYAPESRPQYQQFENRQPVQFPAENASPAPQLNSRSEQLSLFSPASQRADTFKSKVRSRKHLKKIRKRSKTIRKRRNKCKKYIYIVKKKRSYYDK